MSTTFNGFAVAGLLLLLTSLPATASAENLPLVTFPTGTALATGTKIRAINIGVTKITLGSENYIECPTLNLTGTLNKNSGTAFETSIELAAFSGTGSGGDCISTLGSAKLTTNPGTNGLPWCLRSTEAMAEDEFTLPGGICNQANRPIRLILDLTSFGECTYERSKGMPGHFRTHPEDAILSFEAVEFTKISGLFLCPTPMSFDMVFTLEKDQEGSNPLYIS